MSRSSGSDSSSSSRYSDGRPKLAAFGDEDFQETPNTDDNELRSAKKQQRGHSRSASIISASRRLSVSSPRDVEDVSSDDQIAATLSEIATFSEASTDGSEVLDADEGSEEHSNEAVRCFYWLRRNWRYLLGIKGTKVALVGGAGSRSTVLHSSKRKSQDDPPMVVFTLKFRTFAFITAVMFAITIIVGSIVTLTATDYDPDTDLILRFFEVWNPCILMDHWPSNLISMLLMMTWIFPRVLFAFMLMVTVSLLNDPLLTFGTTVGSLIYVIGLLCFLNVFSANLYEDGHTHAHEELDDEDLANISLHSLFYVSLLTATLFFAFTLLHAIRRMGALAWSSIAVGLFTPAFAVQTALMFMVILQEQYPPKADTGVQSAVLWIEDTFKTGAWAWLPSLLLCFLAPSQLGLEVSFQLRGEEATPKKHSTATPFTSPFSTITPEKLFSVAFRIMGFVFIGIYLFTDPPDGAALVSGLRARPFRFVFLPFWMFAVALQMLGVVAAIVRYDLILAKTEPRSTVNCRGFLGCFTRSRPFGSYWIRFCGLTLILSECCVGLIVLPQIDSPLPLLIWFSASLLCWLTALLRKGMTVWELVRFGSFGAVFVISTAIAAIVGSGPVAVASNVITGVTLCLFSPVLPPHAQLVWRFRGLGIVDVGGQLVIQPERRPMNEDA